MTELNSATPTETSDTDNDNEVQQLMEEMLTKDLPLAVNHAVKVSSATPIKPGTSDKNGNGNEMLAQQSSQPFNKGHPVTQQMPQRAPTTTTPSTTDHDTQSDPDRVLPVFIERDYSGKAGFPTNIIFSLEFSEKLTNRIPESILKRTVEHVNRTFAAVEDDKWACMWESILSVLTCTLINIFRKPRMLKAFGEIDDFLYTENDTIYHPMGLHVVHPFARGLRFIEIRDIHHYRLYEQQVQQKEDPSQLSTIAAV